MRALDLPRDVTHRRRGPLNRDDRRLRVRQHRAPSVAIPGPRRGEDLRPECLRLILAGHLLAVLAQHHDPRGYDARDLARGVSLSSDDLLLHHVDEPLDDAPLDDEYADDDHAAFSGGGGDDDDGSDDDAGKGKGKKGGKGKGKDGKGKGKGKGKDGKGKGKGKGAAKQIVEPHRHKGVYIARGKEDVLVTKNMVVGDAVYGEKRIAVEEGEGETKTKVEYRVWNPFRSKIAAAILGGVDQIAIQPGSRVLYLGAASGTSVSHVSDIVGEEGCVYAVEFSHRSGRDLINVAKKRTNIIPIIEDARHPSKYRMLIGMVDCVFADVAQPDQARIVALNSHLFLKNEGHTVISIREIGRAHV